MITPIKITRNLFLISVFLFFPGLSTFATWSIIVADPKTKEIGIAGASCTPNVYGIGAVAPGKGAIVVQAYSNGFAKLTGLNMLMTGISADSILAKLREGNFDPEHQQYAILSLADPLHPLTYSGTQNTSYSGSMTGKGISVQGNTLTSPEVIRAVYAAALKAQQDSLSIQEILMLAMEAGAAAGGDKRCEERKASSAFLLVCKPTDVDHYWMSLIVRQTDDHTKAVATLRLVLEDWKMKNKIP
jgi:uncharacterized Ntn-hydrolase superfamily protein